MAFVMQNNALVHLSRVMWRFAAGHRKTVVFYMTLSLGAMMTSLITPLVMGKLMNAVQEYSGQALIDRSYWLIGIVVALGFLFWFLHGPSRVIENRISFLVKRAFQLALFRNVTLLPMRWHKNHHSGATIDQISRATNALGEFTGNGFQVIHTLARFFGAAVVLTWFMPLAALAIGIITVATVLTVVLFDKKLVVQYRELNKNFNGVAAAVQDYLTNVATVITLRLEGRVAREVDGRTMKIFPLARENFTLDELKWFTTSRFVDLTQAGVLLSYIVMQTNANKVIEVGTLYALSEYLRNIGDAFFSFTWQYGDLVVKSTRVHAVEHIEEEFNREVSGTESVTLPSGWKKIELHNVMFSHEEMGDNGVANRAPVREEKAVTDELITQATLLSMNLTLERGRSYAFVGESGSGKSTALGVLRGIHRATGTVSCDGVSQPHGITQVMHCATLIPQDPEIFSDTIRFNITMGIDADEKIVAESIHAARFESVLARLPKGLDTNVAEKGVNLSGGEKQRLALARGIFFAEESRSDIILFDESTSSVDIFNERKIYDTLLARYKDRCIVSAIHKFNLLHLFDEIVVFVTGKIVERGSLNELLAQNGELHRLWSSYASENQSRTVDYGVVTNV